jgi:hypothetical protein
MNTNGPAIFMGIGLFILITKGPYGNAQNVGKDNFVRNYINEL